MAGYCARQSWLNALLKNQRAFSDALLLKVLRPLLGDEHWQAHEVVSGAAEDEYPVRFMQTAQLHLPNRPVYLSHPKLVSTRHLRLGLIA